MITLFLTGAVLLSRHPQPQRHFTYHYRFQAPDSYCYDASSTEFRNELLENYSWSYLDQYICTRGEGDYGLIDVSPSLTIALWLTCGIIIFKVFVKLKILTIETILSAHMLTHTHACTHTNTHTQTIHTYKYTQTRHKQDTHIHKHSDSTKLNLHSLKRAAKLLSAAQNRNMTSRHNAYQYECNQSKSMTVIVSFTQ